LAAQVRASVAPVLRRALRTPGSLGLLTAAGVMALSPSLWPGVLAAVTAESLLLVYYASSRRFRYRVREDRRRKEWQRQGVRFKRIRGAVDAETAARIERIFSLQQQVLGLCGAAGEAGLLPGGFAEGSLGPTGTVLGACLGLVEKRQRLAAFLQQVETAELQRQAVQLEGRLDAAHDAVTRSLYLHALEQQRGELENCCAIQHVIARIDGQLESIVCTLGNLVGRMVRLRDLDAGHAAAARDRITQQIDELTRSVTALEASTHETLAF
jgi:hypothetical protein